MIGGGSACVLASFRKRTQRGREPQLGLGLAVLELYFQASLRFPSSLRPLSETRYYLLFGTSLEPVHYL